MEILLEYNYGIIKEPNNKHDKRRTKDETEVRT